MSSVLNGVCIELLTLAESLKDSVAIRSAPGGHYSRAELLPRRATTLGRQSPEFVVDSRSQITNALYHREHHS
jgi:hypothetical protein